MPIKLIGTEPYQVPRNSDLGTMAYQDATAISVGSITATGSTVNLITAYSYDNSATVTAQTTTSAGNVASLVLKSPVGNYGFYVADNSNALVLQDYLAGVQRLRVNSTGQMFLGSTTASTNVQFRIGKTITGSASSNGLYYEGQVASDVTNTAVTIGTNISTAGAVTSLYHYNASQATLGGTVANQYGYVAQNSIRDATTNSHFYSENSAAVTTGKTVYGFYSGNAVATGGGTTWGFYANGDAPNYFAGNIGLGITGTPTYKLDINSSDTTFLRATRSGGQVLQFICGTSGTGIIQKGSGFLAFHTNSDGNTTVPSNERMRIANDGTIIIGGTAAANGRLDIQAYSSANTASDIAISRTSSTTTSANGPNLRFGDGTTNNTNMIQMGSGHLQFFNYGDGVWKERMRITSTGDINIGSNALGATTDIRKVTIASAGWAQLHISGDASNTSGEPGGSVLQLSVDGATTYGLLSFVNTAGSSGISGGSTTGSTANSLLLCNTSEIGGIHFATSNIVRATISNDGNLAIGQVPSDTNKFEVTGDTKLTGDLWVTGAFEQSQQAVAALAIDCSAGNFFTKTIAADSTFTFTNVPASGVAYAMTIEITHTSGTITWPTSVKWNNDRAPALTTGKTHLFTFVTYNGGTRWRASALVDYVN